MAANLLLKERELLTAVPHMQYQKSCNSSGFHDLIQSKKRIVAPLLMVSLGFFFCLTLLVGFARPLMSTKLIGSLNIGFFLILVAYLVCWVAAVLYVWAANEIFDKKIAVIVDAKLSGSNQS
ncbi:hypothetical protein; putative membrane protein [Herminiimonas arsenicoxydans]|uniref:DUF485 domain-containing protein n=1 Tax=Herminiimonas arsenicoxydans TaxID=204773 RepID=A4G2X7_HERAR|nr:hypothetical protein; putative membrane protein [Herminiimonas arsenicoxydans]